MCQQINDEECSEETEEKCETVNDTVEERICSDVPGEPKCSDVTDEECEIVEEEECSEAEVKFIINMQ